MSHYEESQQGNKFHGLIIGDKAAGKTTLLGTLPHPCFIMSFNPGGTVVLKKLVAEGRVVIDTRYEIDNMEDPQAWRAFWKNFHEMKSTGFFNQFASFAIDGLTEMSRCILWYLLKRGGRMYPKMDVERAVIDKTDQGPRYQEWEVVLNTTVSLTREIGSLPIHTCITGHINRDKDEVILTYVKSLMFPGQSREQIPQLVPEVYYMMVDPKDKTRFLLTRNDGEYHAGTRMGAGGILQEKETPNLRAMIKKCGYDAEDKPLIKVTP